MPKSAAAMAAAVPTALNKLSHVSQKKTTNRSLGICYLKVIEGQVSSSPLLGTLRVRINSSFFGYLDGFRT